MKKILVVFSIFCLFILASCSKHDLEDIFPPEPDSDIYSTDNEITDDDTADIDDNDTTEPSDDPDTTDNEISDDDTTDIDDNDNDSDDNDSMEPSDDSDTTDNDISDDDTADINDNDSMEPSDDSDTTDNDISDDDTADIDDDDTTDNEITDNDTDTGSGENDPHECAVNPVTPCKSGNLIWSSRSAAPTDWDTAKSKCASYSEGKFTSGWKLPTISELRTVMRNCSNTETGGSCRVTDECVTWYEDINGVVCYTNPACKKVFGNVCSTDVEHSPFGETGKLWSASYQTDNPGWVWYISFYNGEIANAQDWTDNEIYYRCVHAVE